MNKLPKYINCNNKKVEVCEWYMHKTLCAETCAYAEDVRGLGIGAMCDSELVKKNRIVLEGRLEQNE